LQNFQLDLVHCNVWKTTGGKQFGEERTKISLFCANSFYLMDTRSCELVPELANSIGLEWTLLFRGKWLCRGLYVNHRF